MDTECGLLSWRPRFLQRFATIQMFTMTVVLWNLFSGATFAYYGSVVSDIERQYGLSSAETGLIRNINHISYLICVIPVGHFCRYSNKPRIFAISSVIISLAVFLFALPHFLFDQPAIMLAFGNSTFSYSHHHEARLCTPDTHAVLGSSLPSPVDELAHASRWHGRALFIFIFSCLLEGVGLSPAFTMAVTYIDDNVKEQSPKHVAMIFVSRALGPLIGYGLGSWTTNIFVTLEDPDFGPKDPRWVGAWWIGFMICGSLCAVIAFPVLLFPKRLISTSDDALPGQRPPNFRKSLREFPRSFARIASNLFYVCVILATSLEIVLFGLVTFVPKYMVAYFRISSSTANLMTGVSLAMAVVVGPIIGGYLTSHFALGNTRSLRVITGIAAATTILIIGQFFVTCDHSHWAGEANMLGNTTSTCNFNCSCTHRDFLPVCGSDGLNHFSACHAGCSGLLNESSYVNCDCITVEKGVPEMTGEAQQGMCGGQCSNIYAYAIIFFASKFFIGLTPPVKINCILRSTNKQDKGLALALGAAVVMLITFPGPFLFGWLIDSSCLVHQNYSGGACLIYEPERFHHRIHLGYIIVSSSSLILYILANFTKKEFDYNRKSIAPSIVRSYRKPSVNPANIEKAGKLLDNLESM